MFSHAIQTFNINLHPYRQHIPQILATLSLHLQIRDVPVSFLCLKELNPQPSI